MKIKRYKYRYMVLAIFFVAALGTSFFTLRSRTTVAEGECPAGQYPKLTSLVKNGNFATAPSAVHPSGGVGDNSVPGYYHPDAQFYSQMANAGYDLYPDDNVSGYDQNAFSVQKGPFIADPWQGQQNGLDQVTFPGDPDFGVPNTDTWIYTNGNRAPGGNSPTYGPYVNWAQDVSGMDTNKTYVFVAYISNIIEPPVDAPDDPKITFKIGGTSGMPDGTVVGGPTVLTEAATANATQNGGWKRIAYAFTPSSANQQMKIVDESTGYSGDDFAMTGVGISECTDIPDYTTTVSHTGNPTQNSTYTQTVSVNNTSPTDMSIGHTLTVTLPAGFTVNGGAAGPVALTTNNDGYSCTSNAATSQILTCTTSTPVLPNASQTIAFDVAIGGTATMTNVINATVALPVEVVTNNNASTDTVVIAPDIKNTLSTSNQTQNTVTVEQTIENIGAVATGGNDSVEITLADNIKVNNGGSGNVTLGGDDASAWTCTSNASTPQKVTCTHSGAIQNTPSDTQTFSFVADITQTESTQTYTLNSTATTANDANTGNNTSTTDIIVSASTDYTTDLSHSGTPSQHGTYPQTLTIFNSSSDPTTNLHTATVTLPAGYTVNNGGAGSLTLTEGASLYTCTSAAVSGGTQKITCAGNTPVPTGQGQAITFTVAIGSSASATSSIDASVSLPNESTTTNNDSTDQITLAPDLTNTLTISNQTPTSVTLNEQVQNVGTYQSEGNDTVSITLPDGYTVNDGAAGPVSTSGPDSAEWACTALAAAGSQTITCVHANPIQNTATDTQNFSIIATIPAPDVTRTDTITSTVTSPGDTNLANNSDSGDVTITGSTDYTIAISHTGAPSQNNTYNQLITVSNALPMVPGTGHTIDIALPTGYTVNNGEAGVVTLTTNSSSYTCTSDSASPQAINCATNTPVSANSAQQIGFEVLIGAQAASLSNVTSTVTLANESITSNNTSTDTISLAPDLMNEVSLKDQTTTGVTIVTHIENIGTYTTAGNDTVVVTLPTGVTVNNGGAGAVTLSGPDAGAWTCTSNASVPQEVSCTHPSQIGNTSANHQDFEFTASISPSINGTNVTIQSTATTAGDSNTDNNTSTTPLTLASAPDYTIDLSHTGTPSQHGNYTQVVTINSATSATTGEVHTVTVTLPAGYTVNSGDAGAVALLTNPENYTCVASGNSPQVLTCTASQSIATNGSHHFSLSVAIGSTASSTSSINASVSVTGEAVTSNNTATDTISLAPDIANEISLTDQTINSVVVTTHLENIGTYATTGNDRVVITLPADVTVNNGGAGSISLTGADASMWTCTSNSTLPQQVTCIHNATIDNTTAAHQDFAFTAAVAPSASAKVVAVTSIATTSGDSNQANNTSSADMSIPATPDYTTAITHIGTPKMRDSFTQQITVNNQTLATTPASHTVTVTLPSGYSVNNGASGPVSLVSNTASYTCTSNSASPQILTCTSNQPLVSNGTQSFSYDVAITQTAAAAATTTATVVFNGEVIRNNNDSSETIRLAPDLSNDVTITARTDKTITIEQNVSNVGTYDSSDSSTLVMQLPAGVIVNDGKEGPVTLSGPSAEEWACVASATSPQSLHCTHTGVIENNPGSDQQFTLTATIDSSLRPSEITIVSTVSDPNDTDLSNNTSNDSQDGSPLPPPVATIVELAKTGHAAPLFAAGGILSIIAGARIVRTIRYNA